MIYRKVAMKVIRNSQRYIHAAKTEIAILQKIAKHDDGMRFVLFFTIMIIHVTFWLLTEKINIMVFCVCFILF